MDARLSGMEDTRIGRRHGAAVGNGSRLTLGTALSSELLVGEASARRAGVTVAVDATLGGAEDARVCRRHGVTMGNGSFDGSVMNAGLAAVLSCKPVMLKLSVLCSESQYLEEKIVINLKDKGRGTNRPCGRLEGRP